MNIPDAKLDELLALAEKATPGEREWIAKDDCEMSYEALVVKGMRYESPDPQFLIRGSADAGGGEWFTDVRSLEDAAFIAACEPATIRALVEEVKTLRAEVFFLKLPRANSFLSCDCTDVSACESHAADMLYAKCGACGEHHIPFKQISKATE